MYDVVVKINHAQPDFSLRVKGYLNISKEVVGNTS